MNCSSSSAVVERNSQDFMPNREDKAANLSDLVEFCITGESLVQVSVEFHIVSSLLKN